MKHQLLRQMDIFASTDTRHFVPPARTDIEPRSFAAAIRDILINDHAVVVNIRKGSADRDLIEWAKGCGRFVYIGRAVRHTIFTEDSPWCNPFSVKQYGRDEAIGRFRTMFDQNPALRRALPLLKGKVLGCWCDPDPCHGHYIAEQVNALTLNEPVVQKSLSRGPVYDRNCDHSPSP